MGFQLKKYHLLAIISINVFLFYPRQVREPEIEIPEKPTVDYELISYKEWAKQNKLEDNLEENILTAETMIDDSKENYLEELKISEPSKEKLPSRSSTRDLGTFTVTCYDLSVESCGKSKGHKYYGITASGFNLSGHSWETARTIAVDPKIIPLGTKVRITFQSDEYSKYNGIYTARDTGGAIKGNKIDFFLGEDVTREQVYGFGKTKAQLELVRGGN